MARSTRTKRPLFLLPACILLGLLFDVLFWGKAWGISFTLFIVLALGVGLWLAQRQKLKPARASWPLAVAALLLAAVSAVRADPSTLFFTRVGSLGLLMLFAASFLGGDWAQYRFSDYVVRFVSLVPAGLLARREWAPAGKARKAGWGAAAPYLRGLLLALPVVFVLGGLLSSADGYFANWLSDIFGFLRLENLPEYMARLVIVLVVAFFLMGAYLYAFLRSKRSSKSAEWIKPFIGFTESMTVLSAVVVLFAAFVIFQVRYFFGGLANIMGPNGITYAEYARRGFGELVLVALFTLVLFIGLSALTRRKPRQQKVFSAAGLALFALVAVILASAFQRLLLYEEAYGFTQARTAPHIFMIWLGLLLLALVFLEATARQGYFALAVLGACFGFVATLTLLNMDAFIVRANVAHAQRQEEASLDIGHLGSLSSDAAPALAAAFQQASSNGETELAVQIAAAFTCNAISQDEYRPLADWQSWNTSRAVARQAWLVTRSDPQFPRFVTGSEGNWPYLLLDGEKAYCEGRGWD